MVLLIYCVCVYIFLELPTYRFKKYKIYKKNLHGCPELGVCFHHEALVVDGAGLRWRARRLYTCSLEPGQVGARGGTRHDVFYCGAVSVWAGEALLPDRRPLSAFVKPFLRRCTCSCMFLCCQSTTWSNYQHIKVQSHNSVCHQRK